MGFLEEVQRRRAQALAQTSSAQDRIKAILQSMMLAPTGGVDPRAFYEELPRIGTQIGAGARWLGQFPQKVFLGGEEGLEQIEQALPPHMRVAKPEEELPPPETGLQKAIDIVGPAVVPTLATLPIGGGARIPGRIGKLIFDATVEGAMGYAVAPEGKGLQTAAASAILGPALGQIGRIGGKELAGAAFRRQFTQSGRREAAEALGKKVTAEVRKRGLAKEVHRDLGEVLKFGPEGPTKGPGALTVKELAEKLPEEFAGRAGEKDFIALKGVWDLGGEALPGGKEANKIQRALQENMVRSMPAVSRARLIRAWSEIRPMLDKPAADFPPLHREGLRQWANTQTEIAKDYALRTQTQRDEVFKTLAESLETVGGSKLIKTQELQSAREVLSRLDGPTVASLRESMGGMIPSDHARVVSELNGVICDSPCVPIADILQSPASVGRMVREIRMSGMLSGIGTWLRNTFGTGSRIAINPIRTIAAGGMDWGRAKALGVPRERFAGEVLGELQGLIHGTKAAIKRFQFKNQTPQDLVDFGLRTRAIREFGSKPPSAVAERLSGKLGKIRGKDVGEALGTVTQAPFNALNWQDEFMFTSVYSSEMYRGAYRQALKEGLKGKKIFDRVGGIINQQAHALKDLHRQAINTAEGQVAKRAARIAEGQAKNPLDLEHLTLTEWRRLVDETQPDAGRARQMAERTIFIAREGKRMDRIIDTLDKIDEDYWGVLSIPLPFRRTPANVVRETIRSSPVGLVAPIAETVKGGVRETLTGPQAGEMMDRLGQAVAGTAMLYSAWALLRHNLIEVEPFSKGKGRADRLTKELAGIGQDSLRIGSWSVPIERIEPIGSLILSAAKANEMAKAGNTEGSADELANVAWFLVEQAKNGAFLDSFAQFIDAAVGDDRSTQRFAQRLGGSFVPTAIKDLRRALGAPLLEGEIGEGEGGLRPDKLAWEIAKGFGAQLGIGDKPKLGTFGKERTPGQLFTGIRGDGNPIAQELVRVGASFDIPKLPDGIDAKTLSRDERDTFIKAKGRMQEFALRRVMSNPDYANLSNDVKKRLVEAVRSKSDRKINARARALKARGIKWTTRALLRKFIQTGG